MQERVQSGQRGETQTAGRGQDTMYENDVAAVSNTAKAKVRFMNDNLAGFFLMSMMAGLYIGIGSVFMGVVGGVLSGAGSASVKLVTGVIFSVGLCMVVICGADLFTGSNLVMSIGIFTKSIRTGEAVRFWIICWIGNLLGSVVTAVLFTLCGIAGSGDIGAYMAGLAAAKMNGSVMNLFAKAILCNICVCVAIWGCARLKSEGAKFAMCLCCVAPFVACGFEHSIANMTCLTIGLLNKNGVEGITLAKMCYNLLVVTAGNMVGGIVFVALPYYITGREKK